MSTLSTFGKLSQYVQYTCQDLTLQWGEHKRLNRKKNMIKTCVGENVRGKNESLLSNEYGKTHLKKRSFLTSCVF